MYRDLNPDNIKKGDIVRDLFAEALGLMHDYEVLSIQDDYFIRGERISSQEYKGFTIKEVRKIKHSKK